MPDQRRDPIIAYRRKATAARRVGKGAQCACGENRPEALIAGSKPRACAACQRKNHGKTTMDRHHIAGRTNSSITILVPVNEHRARLSPAQYDWPKETLENPDGSPLLKIAACIRGFIDTVQYLMDEYLLWIAEFLEWLNAYLQERHGPKWWFKKDGLFPKQKEGSDVES
jgi:hypothetical protein